MKLSTIHAFVVVIFGMASVLPSHMSQARALYCKDPRDVLVAEGDNATFSCHCELSRSCLSRVFQWFYQIFPEKPIVINSGYSVNKQFADKFSVAYSHSRYGRNNCTMNLQISNVTTVESGQYFCRLSLGDDGIYHNSVNATLSVSKEVGIKNAFSPLRSPLRCEDISPSKEHQVGDRITLTCIPPVNSEGMIRAIRWSLPWDPTFGGTLYLTPRQHHPYMVTKILQKEDNCKRFRCDALTLRMFENEDDARCAIVPLKIPVTLSPKSARATVGGRVELTCSTDVETTPSQFVWRKQPGDTKERSEINDTEERFQIDPSGKNLTVWPVLAEDDGTKIWCQVWYQMDCRKASFFSTLKVRGLKTTPSEDQATSPDNCQTSPSHIVGAAVGCFLAGVVIASLVAFAVWRKSLKKRSSPTPRSASSTPRCAATCTSAPRKVVRYTPTPNVEMDRPGDNDDDMYEDTAIAPVQAYDDVYETPDARR